MRYGNDMVSFHVLARAKDGCPPDMCSCSCITVGSRMCIVHRTRSGQRTAQISMFAYVMGGIGINFYCSTYKRLVLAL